MFPVEMLTYTLIYAGLFCFLAVVIYLYDRMMKAKLKRAMEEAERKTKEEIAKEAKENKKRKR